MKSQSLRHKKQTNWILALPMYIFSLIFVVIPLIYVIILSFLTRDETWGVVNEFTLSNFTRIFDKVYLQTFLDSIQLAVLTTVICLLLGYPFAYFMAKLKSKWKNICMLLVVVPFWTNALIRIYGWIILLRSKGILNEFLIGIGILEKPIKILYTYPAVLIGMVYSLVPFMILSIYSSVEKMDWTVVEAARDLGATRFQAFWTTTLKMTLPGILSGVILVFVPSVGLFFISDLMGGGKVMLLGNLIKNELMVARDWPFGAALSIMMMCMTLIFIGLYRKVTHTKDLEGL